MKSEAKTTGSVPFSKREREVLKLGAQGATDQEISDQLSISVPTLRTYWLRIREKIGGVNRTHAIALAVAGPLAADAAADPHRRLLERARSQSIAEWAWRPERREVVLDDATKTLFGIASEESALPVERVLGSVWTPDRPRLERFLAQTPELCPMTPLDLRVGPAGDYRQTIRTVNLSANRSRQDGVVVLLASTLSAPGRV